MPRQESQKKKLTKFPISRLKRIMQLNEDIGKIGASVPVVASKAIEMFLAEVVGLTLKEAKKKNSSRMSPEFIVRAIESNSKFEFLKGMEQLKNKE
ncbi:class 2 transcription repressor NC2 subunit alpha [Encephalitozoon intestinalis ATCC 50506]|uniref:Class 2 transcription repressor NC2 subunit alpha n=1 Tax=Encephalitozoon intestinalis (strain ATCC 50506) TaxID=876142 RepID=E0SA13_ENCIT|nr:class 2 transcription repressor NC2 subunit alpha [Encephalitozoon intestinalis ATCC 50506]ADM12635.1 class 2 transcription repressor NC2 subunit alpha [Encephalitozoon intestinalis ATCC 50506]UTX46495.1 histone H2A type 1-D [Encephalitozoon intestinalis]